MMKRKSLMILVAVVALLSLLGACSSDDPLNDGGIPVDGQTGGDGDGGSCAVVCQSSDDCCSGEECIGGICTAGDTCPAGCNYECDKTKNQHCNPASKKCEDGLASGNCTTDCECYTGESCVSGTCQASGGDEIRCSRYAAGPGG